MLKHFGQTMNIDQKQLAPYDHELLTLGKEIFNTRSKFLKKFKSRFDKLYKTLSNKHEFVEVVYESSWQNTGIEDKYRHALKRDLALQRTTVGIHRDVYHFNIEGKPIKRFGSQGQQKSMIVALKIAQFEALKQATKLTPVLLLDDIFDKLDDERMIILLNMICENTFGQIFITDARPERTMDMLAENKLSARIFTIQDGTVESAEDYVPKKKK